MLYTDFPHDPQAAFEPVETLSVTDIVGYDEQVKEFRSRLDGAAHQLRLRTCAAFELGHATGAVAFNILISNGLLGDLDEFMTVYSAGIWKLHHEDHSADGRSLAEGAR